MRKREKELAAGRTAKGDEQIFEESRGVGRKPKITDYPLDYKMEAVRLFIELGSNYAHTKRRLAERHPEERIPRTDTLKRWITQYQNVGSRRVLFTSDPGQLWQEVEIAALDKLLDDVKAGGIPANVLYAIAGVAADKRLKTVELTKGKTSSVHHFHELVTQRRQQLVERAQEQMGLTEEEADAAVEFQETFVPLLDDPTKHIRVDLDAVADRIIETKDYIVKEPA